MKYGVVSFSRPITLAVRGLRQRSAPFVYWDADSNATQQGSGIDSICAVAPQKKEKKYFFFPTPYVMAMPLIPA
jgi:hypothetical protein